MRVQVDVIGQPQKFEIMELSRVPVANEIIVNQNADNYIVHRVYHADDGMSLVEVTRHLSGRRSIEEPS